jgi:hypothetical protein
MSTGESGIDPAQSFRRLVIVCCHAIYLGEASSGREEDEWYPISCQYLEKIWEWTEANRTEYCE